MPRLVPLRGEVISSNMLRTLVFRWAGLLLSFFICTGAFSQAPLTPVWAANGWDSLGQPPAFSADGSKVLVWNYSGHYRNTDDCLTVYNVPDGTIALRLVLDGANGNLSGACFNSSGTSVFYGTDKGEVYDIAIGTASQTKLNISMGAGNGPQYLASTSDGKTLGFLVVDPQNNDGLIVLYDLTSNTQINSFDFINGTNTRSASLAFVNKNTEVVLSGPVIYDFSGKQIAASTAGAGVPVTVSPDQSKVFCQTVNNSISAFSVPNLTQVWNAPFPTVNGTTCYGAGNLLVPSGDGKALLLSGFGGDNWYVAEVSAANGTLLNGSINSTVNHPTDIPWVACSPKAGGLLLGPSPADTGADLWTISSTGGKPSRSKTLFEGVLSYDAAPFVQNTVASTGSGQVAALAANSLTPNGRLPLLRNAATGAPLSVLESATDFPSPDGAFYAFVGSTGINVYKSSSNSLVASLSQSFHLNPLATWSGNSQLVISDDEHDIYVLGFSGTSLSLLRTFTGSAYRLSPDGTLIAIPSSTYSPDLNIFSVTTGKLAYGLKAEKTTATGINDVSFASGGLIGIHESTNPSSGKFFSEFRIYRLNSSGSTLLKTFTSPLPIDSQNYALVSADAVLSPDGKVVVMGNPVFSTAADPRVGSRVQLFDAASGSTLAQWNNQFCPSFSELSDGPSPLSLLNPYASSFTFSGDSTLVYWGSTGSMIAASTVRTNVSLGLSASKIAGGATFSGTVTFAPASASSTTLKVSTSADLSAPISIVVPAHSTSATFSIKAFGVGSDSVGTVSVALGNVSASSQVEVLAPKLLTLSFAPSTVNGGQAATGTLILDAAAGPAGLAANLQTAFPTIVSVPQHLTIPANSVSITFTASTAQPQSDAGVIVSAQAGMLTASGKLTVKRTAAVVASFDQTTVTGGSAVVLTVSLLTPAPAGGTTFKLASSSAALVPPVALTIPAGAKSASIGVATSPTLKNVRCTLTAIDSSNRTAFAYEVVLAPTVTAVSFQPGRIIGGQGGSILVQLSGPSPAGFTVPCASSSTLGQINSSFAFPSAQDAADIPFTTKSVSQVTVLTFTIAGRAVSVTLIP